MNVFVNACTHKGKRHIKKYRKTNKQLSNIGNIFVMPVVDTQIKIDSWLSICDISLYIYTHI